MKIVALLLGVLFVVGCQKPEAAAPVQPVQTIQVAPVETAKPAPAPAKATYDFSECGEGAVVGMAPCWGYTVEVEGDKATVTVGGPQAPEPVVGRLVSGRVVGNKGETLVTLTKNGSCLKFGTVESPLGTKELCR